ncbi:hypothetical protein GCM10010136_25120 [Limoniibacter endophyticus]|uniref:Uncharacterized protein n=1 Tax=Limoniibacter endophyticus TaxID=1565040 RepID=A0A8J3DRJ9_9HYPH|nr:hypothetical protein GCM10010136_25120 [Limoniibacter endophyticus]
MMEGTSCPGIIKVAADHGAAAIMVAATDHGARDRVAVVVADRKAALRISMTFFVAARTVFAASYRQAV